MERIFVNMQVQDLQRSIAFYKALGWNFEPKFTDENSACLVISAHIYCMLHTPAGIARFLPAGRTVTDAHRQFEVMLAVNVDDRAQVEALYEKAIMAGGTPCRPAEDLGFMYTRSFNDPDGHIWEVFWMDPAAMQG
jgi:predicted lactoylglutathione lyase